MDDEQIKEFEKETYVEGCETWCDVLKATKGFCKVAESQWKLSID